MRQEKEPEEGTTLLFQKRIAQLPSFSSEGKSTQGVLTHTKGFVPLDYSFGGAKRRGSIRSRGARHERAKGEDARFFILRLGR